ncbi:tripartite tricarboxylate transporter TctB family protein [Salinarimonas rosea]|uniref:tripartite tricarboxylate transporter TctB family protein n=1 Tax=Salinarimonas rosea TaxID=552063 RepID=UPI00041B30D0|nr:tripartite tricarboxylate transporter TctB family protein [Salinarimonas rosea]
MSDETSGPRPARAGRGVSVSYLAAGLVLLVLAAIVGREAAGMRFYSSLGPGAGFFPAILAGLLAVLALALVWQATVRPADLPRTDFSQIALGGWLRIGAIVAGLLAIAVLVEWAGFRLSVGVFLFALFVSVGRYPLLRSALAAALLAAAYHFVFDVLLRVPLPAGVLGI